MPLPDELVSSQQDELMPMSDELVSSHQDELMPVPDEMVSSQQQELMVNCVMDSTQMDQLMAASREQLQNAMDASETFGLMWDSGASCCISPDAGDFIGDITPVPFLKKLSGMAKGLWIKGEGKVSWSILDIHGRPRTFELPCYHVPNSPLRLMSTGVLLSTYQGETIKMDSQSATLSGIEGDPIRTPVQAFACGVNNIPTSRAYRLAGLEQAALSLNNVTTVVSAENINLSEVEKELLRWHQRLGHLSFRKVQFLMRTGVLASSTEKRSLHTAAARIRIAPKCAACQFGKQTVRSIKPRSGSHTVRDTPPQGTTTLGVHLPGQRVFVDHFVTSTRGIRLTSRGGRNPSNMFSGGCIFVDGASGLIHVEHQIHLNTHETLEAKRKFDTMCRDMGVVPQTFFSDSGTAFTSRAFEEHLQDYRQIIRFAGTSAHHSNNCAERAIRTVVSIARTMMLHAAMHWPEMADLSLWPMAVDYATFVFNHVPDTSTGMAPIDLFSGQRWPQRRLHDLHVWGAPGYLLAKRLGDAGKIPRFQSRSTRCVFLGISKKHASMIPLLLNPETRAITTPFNVVFDDWFATVGSDPKDLPDFRSPSWARLFGDSIYQHYGDGELDAADDTEDHEDMTASEGQTLSSRERVADAMDQDPVFGGHPHSPVAATPTPVPTASSHPTVASRPSVARTTRVPVQREKRRRSRQSSSLRAMTETHQTASASVPVTPPTPFAPVSPTASVATSSLPASPVPDADLPAPAAVQVKSKGSRLLRELADFNSMGRTEGQPLPARRTRRQLVPSPVIEDSEQESESVEAPHVSPPRVQRGMPDPVEIVDGPRVRRVPAKFRDEVNAFPVAEAHALFGMPPPRLEANKVTKSGPDTPTFLEAMENKEEREAWIAACEKELRGLEDFGCWEEVLASEATTRIIPVHWVLLKKRSPAGELLKHKARIVVLGNQMGYTGYETHAKVSAWSSIRIVLILSLMWGWHTCTCDYAQAFIQSYLDPNKPPVFVGLPRGYKSSLGAPSCLKLKRALYGLDFSPKLWSETLFKALKSYGLQQCEHDPCLFVKPGMMVCTFVDDLAISVKVSEETQRFLKFMQDAGFTLTIDDSLTSFLGIKFERGSDGTFTMTQPGLIDKIINATGLQECNPNGTPSTPNQTLGKDPDGDEFSEQWSYPSVCGMLLYLSTNTRCDIAFAVSQVCRFTHCYKQSHAKAVKMLVRYLAGTREKGTIMKPNGTLELNSHSDSDLAGLYKTDPMEDPNSARSRMGYIISLGGCPLVWKSQLIGSICLATAEAEYYSLSRCLRTLIPIRRTLEEVVAALGINETLRATISSTAFGDNSAAITLATQQRLTSRTRYYHTAAHHFWQHVGTTVFIKAIASALMDADYMTKSMPRPGFEANRKRVQGW